MAGQTLGEWMIQIHTNAEEFKKEMAATKAVAEQAGKGIDSSLGKASSGVETHTKNMSRSLLQVGYAIDDLQYGFRSIVNNIPQIALGLGMGAGVAGGAAIAAVAISQLVNNWGYLSDAMQASWSGSTIEQLQSIRKNAEEAAEAFEKLSQAPTKMQAIGAKGVTDAIVEGPIGKVLEGVLAGVVGDKTLRADLNDDEKRKLQMGAFDMRAGGPAAAARMKALREDISKRLDAANRQKAMELIGQSKEMTPAGDAARATLERFADKNPLAFPAGFLGDLKRANPEDQKRQAALERQGDLNAADLLRKQQRMDRQRNLIDRNERGMEGEDDRFQKFNARNFKEDAREKQRLADEAERRQTTERHLRRRVRDIMKPEEQRSAWFSPVDFSKQMQAGILNNDVGKKQLEQLTKIRELLEDNPGMAGVINNAVAAGPP